MKKHHETKDDEHPWLNGFEKKHGNEKIDILKKILKNIKKSQNQLKIMKNGR